MQDQRDEQDRQLPEKCSGVSGISWVSACVVIAFWVLIVAFVNPVGNFMVNDDWAFTRAFETFKTEGHMPSTGWGPQHAVGGPSLVAQLIWTLPFSYVAGTSPTVLRVAVLTLAALATLGLLALLVRLEVPPCLSLFATLTVLLNPLFLSQSFSFMTDIPFVSFLVFSLLCLFLGIERTSIGLIVAGLLLSLCAILTRQAGIVLPVAFAASSVLTPWGRTVGRLRVLLLVIGLCVVPWLSYELFLGLSGSTPVTQHQVIHAIFLDPLSKGLFGYLSTLAGRLAVALAYTCFFVSPVLLLVYDPRLLPQGLRRWLWFSLVIFGLMEVGILLGIFDLPVAFHRNVIFDFGIGPLLLKDTYVLGIARTWTLPAPLFYALVYWAFVSMIIMVGVLVSEVRPAFAYRDGTKESARRCFTATCLIAMVLYGAIILLTGFHDRYLIPMFVLSILFLFARLDLRSGAAIPRITIIASVVLLFLIGSFSVLGVHDFMSMKRSLAEAHRYLTDDVRVDPCRIDGGFEFNGYHCYRKDFRVKEGLSWWWVDREDYLITLGPLDGYRVERVFPFRRLMGPDGAVTVLRPHERNN